jgi:DNA-binding PadR family transcriptional regulator
MSPYPDHRVFSKQQSTDTMRRERQSEMSDTINTTSAALLGLLHDGPQSGARLCDAGWRLGGTITLTRSQVYRELATMEASGLIRLKRTGPRKERTYAVAPRGRKAFQAWLSEGAAGVVQMRHPGLLRALFADRMSAKARAGLYSAGVYYHRQMLSEITEARKDLTDDAAVELLALSARYHRSAADWFTKQRNTAA